MVLPLLILLALSLPFGAVMVIKGGTESTAHSRHYMASITVIENNHIWKACGVFLVQEDSMLTVAHCYKSSAERLCADHWPTAESVHVETRAGVQYDRLSNNEQCLVVSHTPGGRLEVEEKQTCEKVVVILGAHNFTRNEPTMQTILVIQAVPHPEYDPDSVFSDIMVLKLKRKARPNRAVKMISLPRSHDWVKPGQVCSVAGWGKTENDKFPNILQEVELEVQEKKMCEQLFSPYDDATQLCVGNPLYLKNAEMGDSSAPLVCNNVAQGTVSNGFKNCSPGVFARISSFVSWIHKIVNAS
ncbi:granzyme-like protein 2 [Loxodonta africana]|uniref:granzyme-like protein 2 n=1 Tax=Loxodonta africana TaxID=9785 RepID=UPI0030CB3018